MILSGSLVLLLAAPPAPPVDDPCPFGDNRCKAKLYLERAEGAASPRDRALYFFGASRLYLRLFDKTGADADLCASRRAYDRSLAVKEQPEAQRASFMAQLTELTRREGDRGVRCAARRRTKSDPPLMAIKETQDSSSPPPSAAGAAELPVVTQPADPAAVTTRQDELLPVIVRNPDTARTRVRSPAALDLPRQDHREPRRDHREKRPRDGRGLVIAGGATLGVGLALTAAAGYLGGQLLDARGEARRIEDNIDGFATDEQAARSQALIHEYERLGSPTLALALVGGTSVVVGAVLVGVGGRRLARVAERTALLPFPGGLAFRARF